MSGDALDVVAAAATQRSAIAVRAEIEASSQGDGVSAIMAGATTAAGAVLALAIPHAGSGVRTLTR